MAKNRTIPEVSAGSMADIAFLLLIFFLVATTMNVDTGITRVLPQIPPEDQEVDVKVKERNLLVVFVNRFDDLQVAGERMHISQLKDKVKEFVLNVNNDENLPEKKLEDIEGFGQYEVSEGVVSLQNDTGTSYNMYIQVQNELTKAFNEIRDQVSSQRFNRRFTELNEAERKAVQTAVPMKISEAEPRNVEGGR